MRSRCQRLTGSVKPVSLDIRPADRVDHELVEAFAELIPQLSSSSPPPTADELSAIIESPDSVLYVARLEGHIVGSLEVVGVLHTDQNADPSLFADADEVLS